MKKLVIFSTTLFLLGCEQQTPLIGIKGVKVPMEQYQHCNHFVPDGFPQHSYAERKTYFICQSNYVMEFNPYTGTAMWVAERLSGKRLAENKNQNVRASESEGGIDKGFRHTPTFKVFQGEPTLEAISKMKSKDFVPYPLSSPRNWRGNEKAQSQTYYLTNVFPANENNLELFYNTEELIRSTIEKAGEGYIISGAIYQGEPNNLGALQVRMVDQRGFMERMFSSFDPVMLQGKPRYLMPTHLYKLVHLPKTKQTAVFILPNTPTTETDPRKFVSNLANLQKMTSLNFFPISTKKTTK